MPEISSGNPINDTGSRPINSRSRFNNSYRLAGTYRFGEYQPHFAADVIPNDNHVLKSGHIVRSYTLGQPMMQNLDIKKDYFFVPLSAIIPLNYEKFITIPNIGDDVNSNLVGTTVVGFTNYIYNFLSYFKTYVESIDVASYPETALTAAFKYVTLFDMLLSDGSLLSSLGCHIAKKDSDGLSCDVAVDAFWSLVADSILSSGSPSAALRMLFDDLYAQIGYKSVNAGDSSFSLREAICRMRDDFDFSVYAWVEADVPAADIISALPDVADYLVADSSAPIDLGRCFSYQIACAHFYSNDHVDYIYTAELYRQNIKGLFLDFFGTNSGPYAQKFTLNGVQYSYDILSANSFINWFNYFSSASVISQITAANLSKFLNYIRLIFGYNRSLRFVDYFTGSRTQPLATGDATVAVNNNYVDVVDLIEKRWYVKLWNQVNRVGRKMSEQMKGMFPGVHHVQDYHEPIWLGHTADSITRDEVDNTGAEQFSSSNNLPVTSSFNANAERYAFSIDVPDYYGYIIGVTYFDITRFYSRNIERTFFNIDRFDKFNPFLQFNGDQKVWLKELFSNSLYSDSNIFGYQGSYMELKQRVNEAFGGFINDALPGMLFLADEGRDQYSVESIGPDYIRSYPTELDRFYKSLTGYSLGTYFHFIVISTNDLESNRPMAANPQID